MKELVNQMKVVLATNFSLYLKTHYFHWNIEGPNFPQYHEFLNNMYELFFEGVDIFAEEIRTLESYAPGSFRRYLELSKIEDELNVPTAQNMLKQLQTDNIRFIVEMKKANKMAEEENAVGLANILQDRIDKHYKYDWMLKATLKA